MPDGVGARRWRHCRGAFLRRAGERKPASVGSGSGPSEVQLCFKTELTFEEYVTERGWEKATLGTCPFHPKGGCGFAAHGTYMRKVPDIAYVARAYCPEAGVTIGLLPEFYASRMRGTLDALEETVARVEQAESVEKAAEEVRPGDREDAVTLPTAVRWVRLRVAIVKAVLVAVLGAFPGLLAPGPPTVAHVRARLGTTSALVALRQIAGARQLYALPGPLGLNPPPGGRFIHVQQSPGSDGPPAPE